MTETLFGTDGIRSTYNTGPLTHANLARLGYAMGEWITQKYGSDAHIVIGKDHRISDYSIVCSWLEGIKTFPLTILDAGHTTTPQLAAYLRYDNACTIGIMFSASHNAYTDNGIKIMSRDGKITHAHEQTIATIFETIKTIAPRPNRIKYHTINTVHDLYVTNLALHFESNSLQGRTVVLDCAHGAIAHSAPAVFSRLGAQVITLHANPNGFNINEGCGSLHPEKLTSITKALGADLGFAFDGDGDRVVAVNKAGTYKNGDDILALLSQHPHYAAEKKIVGTILSNEGLAHYFTQHNKQLIRVAVGDKEVSAGLAQNKALLGGEPAGHIIMTDFGPIGDGLYTALMIADTARITDNWELQSFVHLPQFSQNFPVTHKANLLDEPYRSIIDDYSQRVRDGRVIVRFSGTEPLLRIMIEHADTITAAHITESLAQKLVPYFI